MLPPEPAGPVGCRHRAPPSRGTGQAPRLRAAVRRAQHLAGCWAPPRGRRSAPGKDGACVPAAPVLGHSILGEGEGAENLHPDALPPSSPVPGTRKGLGAQGLGVQGLGAQGLGVLSSCSRWVRGAVM